MGLPLYRLACNYRSFREAWSLHLQGTSISRFSFFSVQWYIVTAVLEETAASILSLAFCEPRDVGSTFHRNVYNYDNVTTSTTIGTTLIVYNLRQASDTIHTYSKRFCNSEPVTSWRTLAFSYIWFGVRYPFEDYFRNVFTIIELNIYIHFSHTVHSVALHGRWNQI